jgi:hypothetical protein
LPYLANKTMAHSEYVMRDGLEYDLVFQGSNVDQETEGRLPNITRINVGQISSDVHSSLFICIPLIPRYSHKNTGI